jgi:hypothetical protein
MYDLFRLVWIIQSKLKVFSVRLNWRKLLHEMTNPKSVTRNAEMFWKFGLINFSSQDIVTKKKPKTLKNYYCEKWFSKITFIDLIKSEYEIFVVLKDRHL